MHLIDRSRISYDFEILEECDNCPWFHYILQFVRDQSFPSHANSKVKEYVKRHAMRDFLQRGYLMEKVLSQASR